METTKYNINMAKGEWNFNKVFNVCMTLIISVFICWFLYLKVQESYLYNQTLTEQIRYETVIDTSYIKEVVYDTSYVVLEVLGSKATELEVTNALIHKILFILLFFLVLIIIYCSKKIDENAIYIISVLLCVVAFILIISLSVPQLYMYFHTYGIWI